MFSELEKINQKPGCFEFYTAEELWTNEHTAKCMLEFHLNESIDVSSRNIKFIEKSVSWIASHFNICSNTNIIDFGCGPGLYTTRLAEKGINVTGIDFSESSIQYAKNIAKEKELNINYIQQNYLEFATDQRFDLITMIMCDFCALSPVQRKKLLTKFEKCLKPNGTILLDVYSINAYSQREEVASYEYNQLNGFWSSEKYYGFLNTFKYEQEKVILDKYTIIGENKKTYLVYNWLQYFNKDSICKEFEESGFTVEELYSNIAGEIFTPESSEFAIVAKKK